jgi:hypothetical protein
VSPRPEPGTREASRDQEGSSPHARGAPPERTVLTATEARQGEIILGKHGRWIWIGSFAVIVLFLVLGFWL